MSTPFQGRPGAQSTYAAIRGAPPAEVIDPAAHSRLDSLEDRVDALEAARENGEDEQESA